MGSVIFQSKWEPWNTVGSMKMAKVKSNIKEYSKRVFLYIQSFAYVTSDAIKWY